MPAKQADEAPVSEVMQGTAVVADLVEGGPWEQPADAEGPQPPQGAHVGHAHQEAPSGPQDPRTLRERGIEIDDVLEAGKRGYGVEEGVAVGKRFHVEVHDRGVHSSPSRHRHGPLRDVDAVDLGKTVAGLRG